MALKVDCMLCARVLGETGALLFSPPDAFDKVFKKHICRWCYKRMIIKLREEDYDLD